MKREKGTREFGRYVNVKERSKAVFKSLRRVGILGRLIYVPAVRPLSSSCAHDHSHLETIE